MLVAAWVRQNWNGLWIIPALVALTGVLVWMPLTSAAVIVGGSLAGIALLRWPELALYGLLFAIPYGSWFPIPVSVGNLTAVDLLVAGVLALWVVRMIVRERAIRVDWPPLTLPFAIFLGAALVSITGALSFDFTVKELVKWIEMFAIYVFVANNLDSRGTFRTVAVLILAGLSEAAIGIYQFLFRVGPEGFALFGRFMRAYGTFEQPNPYAGYLGLIAPIALGICVAVFGGRWLLDQGKATGRPKSWTSAPYVLAVLGALALVPILAALLMSWSRGAWMGVGVALVGVLVVQSRRALILTLIATFILTFVILLSSINVIPNAIAERFSGVADYFGVFDVRGVKVDDANFAIVERMAHWQAALEMFATHPLLGVGFGNYAEVYPAYALPRWNDPLGHAHNYYLNVAAETGLVGLAAYLLLWSAMLWHAWQAVRVAEGFQRGLAAGLLGMILVLAIHNGFDNLFVHGMAVQVGIGLGIISAIGKGELKTHG